MNLPLRLAALAVAVSPVLAQESYWIANRASSDIMQISPWGSVMQRIAMPTTLRSAHVAPDGKVWVVRFIQSSFDIVDPVTAAITSVPYSMGNPFKIAFDAQGHGWVSGGTGVQEFDAAGNSVATYALSAAAPLGITVDSAGNKWIAHRTTPASVSRIDALGQITNFPLPGVTTQPTDLIADFRGLFNASHIWIVGDGAAQLVEIDDQGTLLNNYPLPITSVGSVVFDKTGDIWVGSFGATGSLLQLDRTNGSILNTYAFPPSVNGLAVDSLGRLLATARVTFSGVGPPCEVRRIDPATGTMEISTVLESGGFPAAGTQSAVSTPFQHSLVVDPLGDMDSDGEPNYSEIQGSTSPTDPWSNSVFSVSTSGTSMIGSTPSFDIRTAATSFWLLTFSWALVPSGTGITLPGFGGEMLLDPVLGLGVTVSGLGPTSLGLTIPNDPSYQGFEIFTQGFVAAGPTLQFTNVSGLKFW